MDRLDELVHVHPLPTWRPIAWIIMLLLAGGMSWAYYAELDEVTIAQGTVVPKGDLKVVQHLEGGIISKINVKEGSKVRKGDIVVLLDRASSGLNRKEIEIQIDGNIALKARLDAEASGKEPVFPKQVRNRRPRVVAAQSRAFFARTRELASTLSVLNNQIRQRELEVKELNTRRSSNKKNLKLAQQRLRASEDLLAQNLVPRFEHLKLQAEVETLEAEISTLDVGIPRTQASVNEARSRLRESNERFKREAQDELAAVVVDIAKLEEELAKAIDRSARLEIKSPSDGIVKNIRFTTIGGVVKPGEPIMEIVPTGEKLVIKAKLNPIDIGFVTVGQPARVKVSTYDFIRYGALDGVVTLVAADVTEDDDGPFFEVMVEMEKTYLGATEGELPITAGMQATVDIHTGKKSVIDFLIKPVLKMKSEAFRER